VILLLAADGGLGKPHAVRCIAMLYSVRLYAEGSHSGRPSYYPQVFASSHRIGYSSASPSVMATAGAALMQSFMATQKPATRMVPGYSLRQRFVLRAPSHSQLPFLLFARFDNNQAWALVLLARTFYFPCTPPFVSIVVGLTEQHDKTGVSTLYDGPSVFCVRNCRNRTD